MVKLFAVAGVFIIAMIGFNAEATTIATNAAGTADANVAYYGQSFTIAGSGSFDDIAFNFFSTSGAPEASGNLYLFSSAYTGTPNGLSSASANLLGSAAASGGFYTFDPSLTLTGGTQYFAYSDTSFALKGTSGDVYSGGAQSGSLNANTAFQTPIGDANFTVTGDVAPVPEAASWAMFIGGFGAIGFGLRRRRASISFA